MGRGRDGVSCKGWRGKKGGAGSEGGGDNVVSG